MHHKIFFQKLRLGPHVLKNRIVHPSLTCVDYPHRGSFLGEIMGGYYEQRVGAGMIVSEAIHVGSSEQKYNCGRDIRIREQIERWRHITHAVHSRGAVIFAQLTHNGYFPYKVIPSELFHSSVPSARSPALRKIMPVQVNEADNRTALFPSVPDKLAIDDIKAIVTNFAEAACAALESGFDGVEIQAGNNHLVHQFLSEQSNDRRDIYGGTIELRLTLLSEVIKAVTGQIGAGHTGVCITPSFDTPHKTQPGYLLIERNPHETYLEAIELFEAESLAYISITEVEGAGAEDLPPGFRDDVRRLFSGRIISSGGYTTERAEQMLSAGWSDLVGFGRPFLVNPDLPERIASGWPLASRSAETLYHISSAGSYD